MELGISGAGRGCQPRRQHCACPTSGTPRSGLTPYGTWKNEAESPQITERTTWKRLKPQPHENRTKWGQRSTPRPGLCLCPGWCSWSPPAGTPVFASPAQAAPSPGSSLPASSTGRGSALLLNPPGSERAPELQEGLWRDGGEPGVMTSSSYFSEVRQQSTQARGQVRAAQTS